MSDEYDQYEHDYDQAARERSAPRRPQLAAPDPDVEDTRPGQRRRRRAASAEGASEAPSKKPVLAKAKPGEQDWGFDDDESGGIAEWKLGLALVLVLLGGFGFVAWRKYDVIKELAQNKIEAFQNGADEAENSLEQDPATDSSQGGTALTSLELEPPKSPRTDGITPANSSLSPEDAKASSLMSSFGPTSQKPSLTDSARGQVPPPSDAADWSVAGNSTTKRNELTFDFGTPKQTKPLSDKTDNSKAPAPNPFAVGNNLASTKPKPAPAKPDIKPIDDPFGLPGIEPIEPVKPTPVAPQPAQLASADPFGTPVLERPETKPTKPTKPAANDPFSFDLPDLSKTPVDSVTPVKKPAPVAGMEPLNDPFAVEPVIPVEPIAKTLPNQPAATKKDKVEPLNPFVTGPKTLPKPTSTASAIPELPSKPVVGLEPLPDEPIAVEPIAMEPLGLDPLPVEPVLPKPSQSKSKELSIPDPFGGNSLALEPVRKNPSSAKPLSNNPFATKPVVTSPKPTNLSANSTPFDPPAKPTPLPTAPALAPTTPLAGSSPAGALSTGNDPFKVTPLMPAKTQQEVPSGAPQRVDTAIATRHYKVGDGENYWSISKKEYGTVRYFAALAEYNKSVVRDPRHLRPGMLIELPPADLLEPLVKTASMPTVAPRSSNPLATLRPEAHTNRQYQIRSGESYWSISKSQYGTSRFFAALAEWNKRTVPDPRKLRAGMTIELPAAEKLEPLVASASPNGPAPPKGTDTGADGLFQTPDGSPMYRVGRDETLGGIAQKTLGRSSRWRQIYIMNQDVLSSADLVPKGVILKLPKDATRVASGIR